MGSPPRPLAAVTGSPARPPAPSRFRWQHIATTLRDGIRSGALPPGSHLESEATLSRTWGVSRSTVRRAIRELTLLGLVERDRGIGTRVLREAPLRLSDSPGIHEVELTRQAKPALRTARIQHVPADADVAASLGVAAGTRVVNVQRVLYASGSPVAVVESFRRMAPATGDRVTTREIMSTFAHGREADSRARGIRITVEAAGPEDTRILGLMAGSPVLLSSVTTFDVGGEPIGYDRHRYRPDHFALLVVEVA